MHTVFPIVPSQDDLAVPQKGGDYSKHKHLNSAALPGWRGAWLVYLIICSKRRQTMHGRLRLVALIAALVLVSAIFGAAGASADSAAHVRWDIIHFSPPGTVSPGGVAFAVAPSNLKIELTGSGTFVAPASGGTSGAVTGGGTWETFDSAGVSTGSGTYRVTKLADWEFANFQTPGLTDLIGDTNERANGNAVLRIEYSDGSQGTLGIGCHGPGAPDGIVEGVIATKGYVTYWAAQPPAPDVDANRTIFHVER
jgi:hypothetical protein